MDMKYRFMTMAVCLSAMLVACNDEDDEYMGPTGEPELIEKDEPTYNTYNEQFRPQIHYTPARNWTNDPNGMVYADGVWHLFYQYNPWGHDWGNMSWGHATSTDLMHWKEQPVALYADELGYIYSGSAVVDEKNVAGFGEGAIIAFYTSHGAHEQQSLAYSTDGGMTFTKYDKNPIVKNTTYGDYRDPKVVWDEEAQTWYMVVATGGDHGVAILRSTDLKTWRSTTVFHAGAYPKCNEGV